MRSFLAHLAMRVAAAWWALALKLRGETPRAAIERRFDEAANEAVSLGPLPVVSMPKDVDVPDGYVQVEPRGITATPIGGALLLVDAARERYVPVFIGGTEALALDHKLQGRAFPRPLPYDLFEHLLLAVGAELTGVRIDELSDDVFIATLVVQLSDERQIELDARASDAVILALGRRAPIVVAVPVIESSSRPLADVPA
jgi:bifunctional DNase/RNase